MADLYSYFIEKGIGLLNNKGLFGIIVANKWMRANYGEPLRKWIKNQNVKEIIDFGDLPVFQGATTYPSILICDKQNSLSNLNITNVKTLDFINLETYVYENNILIKQNSLEDSGWNLANEIENKLLKKLKQSTIPLGGYVKGKIYRGVLTGLNEAFIIDEKIKQNLIKEDENSKELIKPFLGGRDIKRYQIPDRGKYLIFIPKGFTNSKGNNPKNAWKWVVDHYPAIAKHLKVFEEPAKKRYDKGDYWWELRACDYYEEFNKSKILLPDIALRMQALFDDDGFYCANTAYIIPGNDKFLIGILNSKLVQYYYSNTSSSIRGGYFRFIRQYLEMIPITMNKENKELIKLVDQLINLNGEKSETKLQTKVSQIESKIEYCENRINEIVYQLYDLNKEEIAIIENIQ